MHGIATKAVWCFFSSLLEMQLLDTLEEGRVEQLPQPVQVPEQRVSASTQVPPARAA